MLRRPVRRARMRWVAVLAAVSATTTSMVLRPPEATARPIPIGADVTADVPTGLGSVQGAQVLDLGGNRVGVWSWSTTAGELAVYRLVPGPTFALESVTASPLPVPTNYEPIAADGSRVAYETGGRTVVYDVLSPAAPVWSETGTDLRDFWWPYVLTGSAVPDRVVDVRSSAVWAGPESPTALAPRGFLSGTSSVTFDVAGTQPFASPVRGAVDVPVCDSGGWVTAPVPGVHGVAYTCDDQDDWRWHVYGTPSAADVQIEPIAYIGHLVNTKTSLGALSWVTQNLVGSPAHGCRLTIMEQRTGWTRETGGLPCTAPTHGGASAVRSSPVVSFVGGDGRAHLRLVHPQGQDGDMSVAYAAAGGTAGPLGQPLGRPRRTAGDGWTQDYRGGRVHWSQATRAHAVHAPISAAYDALWGESGVLGYPVGGRRQTANGGWTQDFQHGRVHASQTGRAHAVHAPIAAAYDALWGESGPLGYPVGGRRQTANGGWTQDFQHGQVSWSQSTGAHAVYGHMIGIYRMYQGESGRFGYPLGGRRPTAHGGATQDFQFARIHWSPATGAYPVFGPIGAAYDRLGGESGRLGYPVGGVRYTPGGVYEQDFQRGRITERRGQATVTFY